MKNFLRHMFGFLLPDDYIVWQEKPPVGKWSCRGRGKESIDWWLPSKALEDCAARDD